MKFNKKSAITTVKNVLVGGAANVAIDAAVKYANAAISPDKAWDSLYVNIGKVVGGAVLGAAVSNGYARAAADGIATVGASGLASVVLDMVLPETSTTTTTTAPSGMPWMGTGKIKMGQKGFPGRVKGTGSAVSGRPFISK